MLLLPDIDVAIYWVSLADDPADILPWYPDHGTMEQYHSEYKTDRDLERLPSEKFATNALILQVAMLVFNILRIMGQATLHDSAVPLRSARQRRHVRTVVQNLITCAAKICLACPAAPAALCLTIHGASCSDIYMPGLPKNPRVP